MSPIQIVSTLISGSGLVMFLLALPLLFRRVSPNILYGVRTKASFSSEEDWYRINYIGGRYLTVGGVIVLCVGIAGFFLPDSALPVYGLTAAAVTLVAIIIPGLRLCFLKPLHQK